MMRKSWTKAATLALGLLLAAGTGGCLAAAAGVGAAAGIYLTEQGAQGMVAGNLATVDARTRTVLNEMGITVEERTERTNGFHYRGATGDLAVNVELVGQEGGTTEVRASAQRSPVEWDRSYARTIVQRIATP
jgi:hypothetical protein